jgi:hypothetical protein
MAELAHQAAHTKIEYSYAEMLEWLREEFAEWPVDGIGVQAARLRFLLACMALGVPHKHIAGALPGFNLKNPGHPRRRLAYYPDRDAMPWPEPYYSRDPERWMKAHLERYKAYLEGELKKAEQFKNDRVRGGTVVVRREYTARHRTRKLDLAEKYFIAVRHIVLLHPYKDIMEPDQTERQLIAVVQAVRREVRPYQNLSTSKGIVKAPK